MVRLIKCTCCGRELKVHRVWQGQQFTCEACGQIYEPSEQPVLRRSAVNELLETALADVPPPPQPRAVRRFPWLIVVGAVLGLAAFAGAFALVVSRLGEEPALTPRIAVEDDQAPRPSPPDRKAELPDWKPDPDIENRLADRVGFGRWSWRLPKGFERANVPAELKLYKGDLESWAWAGTEAEDTVLAAIHLDSGEMKRLNEPETALADSAQLETAFVERLMRASQKSYRLGDFTFMPGDSGRLARRKFQRVDFKGTGAGSKRVYGVLLFSREGRSLLALVATSPLSPGDELRAELVAALLTLKLN